MLPRQAVEAESFFDVLFHPGVPFAPLQQAGRQVLSRLLVVPPVIDPAQFLQAIVMSEVLERKQTSLVFEIYWAHNRLKFRLYFSRKWRKARNCHAGNALST
jgi:hypothetical protein